MGQQNYDYQCNDETYFINASCALNKISMCLSILIGMTANSAWDNEDKQTNIRFVALNNKGFYSTCQQNSTFLFTLRISRYLPPPPSDVNTAAIQLCLDVYTNKHVSSGDPHLQFMVGVLASSSAVHGFQSRSDQTRDNEIGNCCQERFTKQNKVRLVDSESRKYVRVERHIYPRTTVSQSQNYKI